MASNQMAVVNMMLGRLGQSSLANLNGNTEATRWINANWQALLDAELRKNLWKFALHRDELAALADTPPFDYDYYYQLPADFIRLRWVGEELPGLSLTDYRGYETPPWQIEGDRIATSLSAPLKIRYVRRVGPDLFTPDFASAFALRLAVAGCKRITGKDPDEELKTDLREEYLTARQTGSIEVPSEQLPDDSWLMSRL